MKTVKITISVPENILNEFKSCIPARKRSEAIAEIMKEKMFQQKRKKAGKMSRKLARDIDTSGTKYATDEIISFYKTRKY